MRLWLMRVSNVSGNNTARVEGYEMSESDIDAELGKTYFELDKALIENKALRAENALLQEKLEIITTDWKLMSNAAIEMSSTIGNLQTENAIQLENVVKAVRLVKFWMEMYDDAKSAYEKYKRERDEARSQVERLGAALEVKNV